METFARYLARQLIANKEYSPKVVPEAAPLVAAADIVLMRSDGMTVTLMCLIDREANPSKQFPLSRDELDQIGTDCLKYTGRVNNAKMPAIIEVVEVGSALSASSSDRERMRPYRRKSLRSKVVLRGILIDTTTRRIWTNGLFGSWAYNRGYLGKLLREPRQAEGSQQNTGALAIPEKRTPIVTYALLALLTAIFAMELKEGIGPIQGLGSPSLQTLIAFGGLNKALVFEYHEWYRLFTAILLHGSVLHLVMNGVCLWMVGTFLESFVGRLWFLTLFMVGGLCGSVMSLTLNSPGMTSVGASGAIMALFTAAYLLSFRLPLSAGRTPVQMQLARVIIPALIPLATHTGERIDFGAHLGGAVSGVVMGFVLLKSWLPTSTTPRLRAFAAAVTAAGCVAAVFACFAVSQNFPRYASAVTLIPDEQLPKTTAEATQRGKDLVAHFPDDPRSHWLRAIGLLKTDHSAAAEGELRVALAKWDAARWQLQPQLELRMRVLLADVLAQEQRLDEAKAIAAPACKSAQDTDVRSDLTRFGLCG
ncbi:MAG TPA: rhomboid family intramembrane serine protease [Steroidobacteraceae bacterium]